MKVKYIWYKKAYSESRLEEVILTTESDSNLLT